MIELYRRRHFNAPVNTRLFRPGRRCIKMSKVGDADGDFRKLRALGLHYRILISRIDDCSKKRDGHRSVNHYLAIEHVRAETKTVTFF